MAERDRYRRISTRMWNDEKFASLSKAPPNAQTLWIWLLTGPFSTNIPGLLRVGEASISEDLDWPLDQVKTVVAELESKSMIVVDRRHRVVWLPRAIAHNPPTSINTVKGWGSTIRDLFPECPLVREAMLEIRKHLVKINSPFLGTYDGASVLPKPLPSAFQEAGSRRQEAGSRKQDQDSARAPEVGALLLHAAERWDHHVAEVLPRAQLAAADQDNFSERILVDRPVRGRFEFWDAVAERAAKAEFLRNKRGGPATFSWVIATEDHLVRLLAGKYNDAASISSEAPATPPSVAFEQSQHPAVVASRRAKSEGLSSIASVIAANVKEPKS